jgi:hypothetical protein
VHPRRIGSFPDHRLIVDHRRWFPLTLPVLSGDLCAAILAERRRILRHVHLRHLSLPSPLEVAQGSMAAGSTWEGMSWPRTSKEHIMQGGEARSGAPAADLRGSSLVCLYCTEYWVLLNCTELYWYWGLGILILDTEYYWTELNFTDTGAWVYWYWILSITELILNCIDTVLNCTDTVLNWTVLIKLMIEFSPWLKSLMMI